MDIMIYIYKQELNLVKSHNLNLLERAEVDKLKLREAESSKKELEEVRLKTLHSILYE